MGWIGWLRAVWGAYRTPSRPALISDPDAKPYTLEMAIAANFAPFLREDGFKGSGRTFRRLRNNLISVVNVQSDKYGGAFAVNLGLQPTEAPSHFGKALNPRTIKEYECQFRRRLADSGHDKWFKYREWAESMDAAVRDAAATYVKVGRGLFAQQEDLAVFLRTMTPEEFAQGRFDFSGFALDHGELARMLSLMRLATGEEEASKAFATISLAQARFSHVWSKAEMQALADGAWRQGDFPPRK